MPVTGLTCFRGAPVVSVGPLRKGSTRKGGHRPPPNLSIEAGQSHRVGGRQVRRLPRLLGPEPDSFDGLKKALDAIDIESDQKSEEAMNG